MSWCKQCNEYMLFPSSHKCLPAWDCWHEWATEEDSRRAFAHDAEGAAEKYAARYDSDNSEYPEEREIFVRPHGSDDKPKRFVVFLESVPSYSAREIKESALPEPTQGRGAP